MRFARRAVRFSDSHNAEALLTLGEAYDAAGRTPDARRTLELALAIAERGNASSLALAIRRRLDQLWGSQK